MTDHRAEFHRHADGTLDIVVSDAIDVRSAAIATLINEVNQGNTVSISKTADATTAIHHAGVAASAHDIGVRYSAAAPYRPTSGRIDDATLLTKVATRLAAGGACAMLSVILAPNSPVLAALSALVGMFAINAIAKRYDHR